MLKDISSSTIIDQVAFTMKWSGIRLE